MNNIKSFIARHPLLTYFTLAFALSWGAVLIITDEFPVSNDQLGMLLVAMLIGPSASSILVTALVSGREGLRALWSRLLKWRVGFRWYIIAILAGLIPTLGLLLALSLFSSEYLPLIFTSNQSGSLILIGITAGLFVAFLEELGWTGFAIPRLRKSHGILAAGLITGFLWGAWHFIVFVESDSFSSVTPLIILFVSLFSTLPVYRVLMVWIYDRTESFPVAMVMHASLTAVALVETPLSDEGMITYMLTRMVFLWVVAVIILAASRKKPARIAELQPAGLKGEN